MKRLTSFDASFLANERGNGHMAIGAVIICDGVAPSQEELLAHVSSRLPLLPRFRQRLAFPPLGLGRPFWVDDPEFDASDHVRRASLPEPGSEGQLRRLVDDLISPPLDRSRPLWELWLVDGFAEERFGVIYRVHHALADGFSAVDIATLLFDPEPVSAGPASDGEPWSPAPAPSRGRLLGTALAGLGSTPWRLLTWLAGAASHPRRVGRRAADGIAGMGEVAMAMARPAPRMPLNAEISPERRFFWASCGLDELKSVKNALGGTVNDVSLAVCAGALRRLLEAHHVDTRGLELKALVPVSLRAVDERGALGNRLTAMRGPLPVGIADPVERLHAVIEAMEDLKSSKQPLGAEAIWQLNDWFRDFAPPWLLRPAAAINFSTRLFNLLVTNIPGPQTPLYLLGREMSEIYPVGFLARRHALAIAIMSYNGSVHFGLLADRHSGLDDEPLTDYLRQEVDELTAAAGARRGSRG